MFSQDEGRTASTAHGALPPGWGLDAILPERRCTRGRRQPCADQRGRELPRRDPGGSSKHLH